MTKRSSRTHPRGGRVGAMRAATTPLERSVRRATGFLTRALMREEQQHQGLSEGSRGGRGFDFVAKAALLRERSRQKLSAGPDNARIQWYGELESRVDLPAAVVGEGPVRRWLDLRLRLPGDGQGLGIETKCIASLSRRGECVARITRDVDKLIACVRHGAIDAGIVLVIGVGLTPDAFWALVCDGSVAANWVSYDDIPTTSRRSIMVAYIGVMGSRAVPSGPARGYPEARTPVLGQNRVRRSNRAGAVRVATGAAVQRGS